MGASIDQTGPDRYRVRWSEMIEGQRIQRQTTVRGTRPDAEAYRAVVLRDLEVTGHHDPAAHRARYAPPANLLDGLLDWVSAAEADGLGASTARRYRSHIRLVAEGIHGITGTPETEPLPVTLLGRPLFDRLKQELAKRGPSMPPRVLAVLWAGWGWISDDPDTYPQVPRRPTAARGYVPAQGRYGRTTAPTMAHVDACMRHLRGMPRVRPADLALALMMRYTGLRVGQVLAVQREDVDLTDQGDPRLGRGWLTVRAGKSEQERADMRPVPLSRHLLADPLVVQIIADAPGAGPLLRGRWTARIRRAWEAATATGEVPAAVWAPPNRRHARPDHAYRAALIAHLRDGQTEGDVIDYLVGHVGGGVQATHYGRDLLRAARAAVDALPPVDWTGPGVAGNVITLGRTRERPSG